MEMEGFEKALLRSGAWRVATQRLVLPWALRGAGLPATADVLEVGSGGGFNAEVLLEQFPSWHMVASDYDDDMVAIARERLARFGDRVRVEQADATALRHPDASFDLVLSIGVGHHIGAWEKAVAESARVLRPGGRLLLVDFLKQAFIGPFGWIFPPVRPYGSAELRAALSDAGFARWRLRRTVLVYRLVAETPVRS